MKIYIILKEEIGGCACSSAKSPILAFKTKKEAIKYCESENEKLKILYSREYYPRLFDYEEIELED